MGPMELHRMLLDAHGEQGWWSDDPFTVMFQAVLVQNTGWPSVVRTCEAFGEISAERVSSMAERELEEAVRPCGFQRAKARTIMSLAGWHLSRGDIGDVPTDSLREELMSIKGVGRETADVILLYAFRRPVFVIDAYARRLCSRLGVGFGDDDSLRRWFVSGLPEDPELYGGYHRLILEHCISVCRRDPRCGGCPLASFCEKHIF